MTTDSKIEEALMDIAQAEHDFEYSYNDFPSVLYCPICEYRIELEAGDKLGSEEFCQNCLAWSIIAIDNDVFYLKFVKYDKREVSNNVPN